DVEVLRAPFRRLERAENGGALRDTLLVECLDAVHPGRRVEMLVRAPVLAVGGVLGRLLEMELQPVPRSDRVEPFPRLAEREADFPIVGNRALQVIHQELWSE